VVDGCVLDGEVDGVLDGEVEGVLDGVDVCAKAAEAPNILNAMIFNLKAFMILYVWLMNVFIYVDCFKKESYQKRTSQINFLKTPPIVDGLRIVSNTPSNRRFYTRLVSDFLVSFVLN